MYPDHGYLVSQLKQRNLPGMRGVSHWTGQPLVHRIIPVNSSQETPRYIHLKTPVQNAKTTRNTIEKRTLAFQKTQALYKTSTILWESGRTVWQPTICI
jgi:hypothetical protein